MSDDLRRLASLVGNKESQTQIINQWKNAVRKLPRAAHLDEPLLLDHIPNLLDEISSALTNAQNVSILEMKVHKSAEEHGAVRFKLGFDVEEVVAEFGLLRDIVQQFAEASGVSISGEVNRTINRVLDKAIAVSLETYVRQQAEEVKRRRQQYLSFVVHDLKTPISAMATATAVIDQKLKTKDPAVRRMLDVIHRNAARLNNRVMEIINEESRLHALTFEKPMLPLDRKNIDFWPIAERLKQDCQSIADSRGNKIRNDVPADLQVYADPDLLVDAFQNLLSNALKYTADGEIVIGGREEVDSTVCWVADTGIGIPPERMDQIFQKGTADPNIAGSSGLGLAIVEKVAQLHQGSVAVESTPAAGSTFRITFPKRQSKVA